MPTQWDQLGGPLPKPSAKSSALPVPTAQAAAPMAQAQTPVQEPQFEVLDLGEGGLGLKLVRLKEMRNTGKISEAHFEWALKRLLRVRTFGCPGDHELVRADTSLPGWTCNVCTKAVPLGTTVFRRSFSKVLLPATLSSQDASVLTFSDICFFSRWHFWDARSSAAGTATGMDVSTALRRPSVLPLLRSSTIGGVTRRRRRRTVRLLLSKGCVLNARTSTRSNRLGRPQTSTNAIFARSDCR